MRRTLLGYVFIGPFILGVLLWVLIPAATAAWLTFTEWNLISAPKYVGLRNILRMFEDRLLVQSLKVTTIYSLTSVPLQLTLSLGLALLLNTKMRGITIFRTIFYTPTIVPAVANAILWAWILNTEFGLLNALLRPLGFPKIRWLHDPGLALPALILMSLWGLGNSMLINLAGLQGIPDVLYEAAEIDGAGRRARFRHVTIPMMSPVIFFNLIMGIIGSFQVFIAGFLITDGGPQNATLFFVLYQYRVGLRELRMGYAATLSWLLFFILLFVTAFMFRYVGRMVYYGDVE
jgi:multiple sugar transport system permease protein